jgi:hypothetical protein
LSIGIWVGAEWQFGNVAPEVARRGGMQRAVTLATERYVFDPDFEPANGGPGNAEANPHFVAALTAFTERWDSFQARQAEVKAIVDTLNSERTTPANDADGRPAIAETKRAAKAAFALGLYGLCWCLAVGRLPQSAEMGEAEDESEGDGEEEADAADEPVSGELATEFSHARGELAKLILRAMPKRKAAEGEPQPICDDANLVAAALLESLLAAMPETFKLEEQRLEMQDGKPHTRQRIVVCARGLRRRIERMLEDFPYRVTAQPLRQPAQYLDGDDYAQGNDTRIHIPLIGYRRTNKFLDDFMKLALQGRGGPFSFNDYIRAVNAQQAVAWRMNVFVLRHAKLLAGLARKSNAWTEEQRAAAADLDETSLKELRDWVREKFFTPSSGERKRYELPGEFLDSALAKAALKDLVDGAEGPLAFYLPWKADYRGRIYAETPWLTPQGGDLQRALFEFAEGRPLDEAGEHALRRHGANLVARDRVLEDLGIKDRQVVTLKEREEWIGLKENDILLSAQAPLKHSFWRQVASKPMQFLAFCHAYRQWKTDRNAIIYLPVQIDGTCNGFQHIAALTGDVALARAVNILPRDDRLPADIYSELAQVAQTTIGPSPLPEEDPSALQTILMEAGALLAERRDLRRLVSRNAAKKVVMTVPYGAGPHAQANRILREVLEPQLGKLSADDRLWAVAQSWAEQLRDDEDAQRWIGKVGKSSFKFPPRAGDADKARLRAARILGSALAWVITRHVRNALRERYPIAPIFGKWLQTVAEQCMGLPLMWLTPLGLPVCQDYFLEAETSLNARLRGKTIKVGVTRLEEQVSERDQAQGLLPNLIHSLDATHLATTINAAGGQGITNIGAIHDCLLCHPNDADKLGQVVRNTFVGLYGTDGKAGKPKVIKDWTRWMKFIARLAVFPNPHRLIGALDDQNGLAELRFRLLENGTDDEKAEAREARALLAEISRFDQSHKALVRMLLDYAVLIPFEIRMAIREAKRSKRKRKRRPEPQVPGDEKPTKQSRRKKDPWLLPGSGELSLTEAPLSDYFFS